MTLARIDIRRMLCTAALAAAVSLFPVACSPPDGPATPASATITTRSPLELECERTLRYLESLIESHRRSQDLPASTLAEAVELQRSAVGLVLYEEYELALKLMDEAIALLGESP